MHKNLRWDKSTRRSHDQGFLPSVILSELSSRISQSTKCNAPVLLYCCESCARPNCPSLKSRISLTPNGSHFCSTDALHWSELANWSGQFWQMVKAAIQKSLQRFHIRKFYSSMGKPSGVKRSTTSKFTPVSATDTNRFYSV